jgi:predicted DNA-binding transcriptional regulator AlpA
MNSFSHIPARAFTEKETAKYIGMSRSFLAQSRMEGQRKNRTPAPPYIQIGRSIRYLRDDLDSWLESIKKMNHN